jgi:general secretion pathway protein G
MRKDRGFTLIELLIVVAIIGIIAAIAIPNLLAAINRGRQKRTMSDMRTIGTAVEAYAVDHSFYPIATTVTEMKNSLDGPYIKSAPPRDGWGTAFEVTSTSTDYSLVSWGRNLTADTVTAGTTTTDFDCDICYSNGVFTQWPEGIQSEG